MRLNAIKSGLVGLALAGALFNSNAQTNNLHAPVYSLSKVPSTHCSRYVRLAAEDTFGKKYIPADAWNMQYHNKEVAQVNTNNIEELAIKGVLKPGMIVGVYNPKSKYNFGKDEKGKPIEYTHVVLYLGEINPNDNSKEDMRFAHQFGKETFLESPKQLRSRGLIFKEILDSK